MKNLFFFSLIFLLMMACGGESSNSERVIDIPSKPTKEEPVKSDSKGVGEIKNVTLNNPLNKEMVLAGKGIYDMKCSACHKLEDKRLIGPGFKGVTERRTPEWIMNMITNVDVMLEEDPTAQKLLEECLTRMPNQDVSKEDARNILEFLFDNDSK